MGLPLSEDDGPMKDRTGTTFCSFLFFFFHLLFAGRMVTDPVEDGSHSFKVLFV
jgi:hypothetical protein